MLIMAIRKISRKIRAYTKNIIDKVMPKMMKDNGRSNNVIAENHRQSYVPGSVPSL